MPLTPEDVRDKRFSAAKGLREKGYDVTEVDAFLDEVEAELARLITENKQLRDSGASLPQTPEEGSGEATVVDAGTPADKPAEKPAERSVGTPSEQIKVTTAAEASSAATRLLELATRNADEVVAEAKQEAQQIVSSAREQADTLDREARNRAENLDAETSSKREQATASIQAERARLDDEVESLRSFEREYRSRLRSYFTQQLDALDGKGEGGGELPAAHGHPQDGEQQG